MAPVGKRVTLGSSGLSVSPLGIGSSYGIGQTDVERAFDAGINLLYWGSWRRRGFGAAVSAIARRDRDDLVVAVESYSRFSPLVRPSVEIALRRLRIEYADILILGMWNRPVPPRIFDAARRLVEAGMVGHLVVSCHQRRTFTEHARREGVGGLMVRYNASHPGAEEDVFPHLPEGGPGMIAYTATCWGRLVDPKRTPAGEPTPRASDCYRFALTHPSVDACLIGPRDGKELNEALTALDRGPMDSDELAWMKRVGGASV